MLTTSVCTAPLWRRIPHGERVSWLQRCRRGYDCITHSEGSNALYYTRKCSSLKTKRLEEKKCDFTQKVPEVPINPSSPPCSDRGWRPAAGWRWSMPRRYDSCYSRLQRSLRPHRSVCLD